MQVLASRPVQTSLTRHPANNALEPAASPGHVSFQVGPWQNELNVQLDFHMLLFTSAKKSRYLVLLYNFSSVALADIFLWKTSLTRIFHRYPFPPPLKPALLCSCIVDEDAWTAWTWRWWGPDNGKTRSRVNFSQYIVLPTAKPKVSEHVEPLDAGKTRALTLEFMKLTREVSTALLTALFRHLVQKKSLINWPTLLRWLLWRWPWWELW